jgi:hypothetical protein
MAAAPGPSAACPPLVAMVIGVQRGAGNVAAARMVARVMRTADGKPSGCGCASGEACTCVEKPGDALARSRILLRQPVPPAAAGGGGPFDPACMEILGRIMSFLYGGAQHMIGGTAVNGPALGRGVMERYLQLLEDSRDLYTNHYSIGQADPVYGSWEGHQQALEGQQRGLRRALDEWRTRNCGGGDGGGGVPAEARRQVRIASDWATRPVPERPRKAQDASSAPAVRRYTLTLKNYGTLTNQTEDQALTTLHGQSNWDSNRLDQLRGEHELITQNREEHSIVGWMADTAGGVTLPPLGIWEKAHKALGDERSAVEARRVDDAVNATILFHKELEAAKSIYLVYKEGTIGGAETVKVGAEVVAIGAAVVFVVAGGALIAGAGVAATTGATTAAATGAGATATSTAGTVTVIAASDSVAASAVLNTALTASAELTVPAELMSAAGDAALWTAEDAAMMSIAP